MKETTGKNKNDLKKNNRGLVLKMIATGAVTTRLELAESLGLSKMAITNIVSEMTEMGLLVKSKAVSSKQPGRTPCTLEISEKAPKLIGLRIGRMSCEAAVCDMNLRILHRESAQMESDMTEEKLIFLVFQLLDTLLCQVKENVVAIGVASIGPINAKTGTILKPYFFYGIENVEIVKKIRERYQLPVFFENDNQSAVLAESLYGIGRGHKDILYVGLGNGIGSGIISNGQRFYNATGLQPELGHVSIDRNGQICPCGNRGCVEIYLRTPVLLEKLRRCTGKFYSYDIFCNMEGNPEVEAIFMEAIENLADALVSVVNILNNDLIILGNDGALWSDRYITALEEAVNKRHFSRWEQSVMVKKPYFLRDAPIVGAACNALNAIFNGELIF